MTFTDSSLLRLDQNTGVEITEGGSGSIAQAIVDSGVLWGRVLTSDDVDFGDGGNINGVRG